MSGPDTKNPIELRPAQQMRARRTPGKFREVTNEVRLIGVSAFGRGVCASLRGVELLEHSQRALEAGDACESLRGNADRILEMSFELSRGQFDMGGERVHGDQTTNLTNMIHSRVHATIDSANVDVSGEDRLNHTRRIAASTRIPRSSQVETLARIRFTSSEGRDANMRVGFLQARRHDTRYSAIEEQR